jgi:hypothetical protein
MSTLAAAAGDEPDSEVEEVHAVGDWALVVRADGAVEARTHWDNGDPRTFTTAPTDEAPDSSATYRYDLSIEQVLARYAHETRFDRDPNKGEHGAALRGGIIEALCAFAPTTLPGDTDGQPVGVIHVNAPTGPSTYVVSEDTTRLGDYATFHPFESNGD